MNSFLLTLPIERPKRTERAMDHLHARGVKNIHQIMAFDGDVSGLVTKHPYEVDNPGSGFNMGPKPVGILLAHYMAWQVASHLGEDMNLFMEDDVILHANWAGRILGALPNLPKEWDVFFLGSCDTGGKAHRKISGDIYEVKYPQCLHCYMVRKKALGYMMATQRKIYGPIDCTLIFHTWPALKVYTLLPRLADQVDTVISD